jgi:hypothetical protein
LIVEASSRPTQAGMTPARPLLMVSISVASSEP